jgi:hypothetical protein
MKWTRVVSFAFETMEKASCGGEERGWLWLELI